MKRLAAIAIASVLGLGLAAGAAAQTRPTTPPADRPSTTTSTRETWKNTQGLEESGKIIGTRVKNAQGKDIGEIDSLLIDPKDGKVTHAVVGVGGFIGIGEKHVIVPWSDVKISAGDRGKAVITMDQATLERAPRYDKTAAVDRDRTTPAASPRTDRDTMRDKAPASAPPAEKK